MNIEIKTKNVENKSRTQKFIGRKVQSSLNRFSSRIKSVSVRLDDDSKSESEFKGSCRIEVEMEPRGRVHVCGKGDSVRACLRNAIRKMEHAVKHDIDRHRTAANIRHRQNKRSVLERMRNVELPVPVATE